MLICDFRDFFTNPASLFGSEETGRAGRHQKMFAGSPDQRNPFLEKRIMEFTKPETMKKRISRLPGFVLLLMVVLGCGQLIKPTRSNTPDFKISVLELGEEFKKNESAANKKYKGKTLEITGRVDTKMGYGSAMTIVFKTPHREQGFIVQCFFKEEDRESFRRIQNGKEYTLLGLCDGKSGNSPLMITHCKLY